MESFNFGKVPIPVDNNYSEIKKAQKTEDEPLSQKLTISLINCLSSFYKEKNIISLENKQKINNIFIGLAVTALSANIYGHFLKKESVLNPTLDTNHSLKMETNISESTKLEITTTPTKEKSTHKTAKIIPDSIKNKSSEQASVLEKEDISMEKMQNIVEEIHLLSEILSRNEELFPSRLFSKKFLTAIKITESGLRPDAQSEKGAMGTMQIMPTTIREVIRYLNKLQRLGILESSLPQEDKLTKENIEKISTLIKSNALYGDAFGEIYLMDLFSNFQIGQAEYNVGEITKARKKILVTYNWSPDYFKKNESNEEKWPNESKAYYKKIFHYMDIISNIKIQMEKMQMLTDVFDLSPILALELKKYERELNEKSPKFDEIIKKVIQDYLITIQEMEKIKEKPLTPEEVKRLIKNFNSEVFRNHKNFIAQK